MPSKKPNLLFIMTDHQRFDSIGMVQAGIEVAPNLNRLADQSVYFTRAYSTCPLCVPARSALFTGVYPTRNGMIYNQWGGESAGDYMPLQQHLAEAGYSVAHIGVDHIRVDPGLRDRVPFDLWVDRSDYSGHYRERGVELPRTTGRPDFSKPVGEVVDGEEVQQRYSGPQTATWDAPAEDFLDCYWADRAVEFIRAGHDAPFALFLFLWAPHPPLIVPEPYASMFPPEELDLPTNVGVPANGEPPGRRKGIAGQLGDGVSQDDWRRTWASHLGLVNLVDGCIGRALGALDECGLKDDTVTVFTVDHGDHLGQHRMYQKMELYDQAIRVPLMFRIPGCTPARVDSPVSHLDIMPTVLDLQSLEAIDLDGRSLRPTLEEQAPLPNAPVFSQYSGTLRPNDFRRATVVGRYKYVYDPQDVPELLDLESDPLEMTNLASSGEYSDTVSELHRICREWHLEHDDDPELWRE